MSSGRFFCLPVRGVTVNHQSRQKTIYFCCFSKMLAGLTRLTWLTWTSVSKPIVGRLRPARFSVPAPNLLKEFCLMYDLFVWKLPISVHEQDTRHRDLYCGGPCRCVVLFCALLFTVFRGHSLRIKLFLSVFTQCLSTLIGVSPKGRSVKRRGSNQTKQCRQVYLFNTGRGANASLYTWFVFSVGICRSHLTRRNVSKIELYNS